MCAGSRQTPTASRDAHAPYAIDDAAEKKLVSVVIPCYNSERYLADTVEGVRRALALEAALRCQVILINDASSDNTFSAIQDLCRSHPWIVGIDLDRNYGQGVAKTAGIPFITGDYAVFMDDDGQHDARAIVDLLRMVDDRYDLVYAQFSQMHESLWRTTASKLNDMVLSLLTKKPPHVTITSFFALSARAVEYLQNQDYYAGSIGYTLFPYTDRVGGVQVDHLARSTGTSQYSLRKLLEEWRRVLRGTKRTISARACGIRTVLNEPDGLRGCDSARTYRPDRRESGLSCERLPD